jgi:hypothetical protein
MAAAAAVHKLVLLLLLLPLTRTSAFNFLLGLQPIEYWSRPENSVFCSCCCWCGPTLVLLLLRF